jgi:hypothetical protein
MTPIDGISSVDIGTYEIPLTLIRPKGVCLMRTGMGPQDSIFVNVIGICSAPAGMVLGKTKGIKILMRRDNRGKIIVIVEGG